MSANGGVREWVCTQAIRLSLHILGIHAGRAYRGGCDNGRCEEPGGRLRRAERGPACERGRERWGRVEQEHGGGRVLEVDARNDNTHARW